MFPILALAAIGSSPLITFVIVGVLVAVALYFIPTILPMDAAAWNLVRIVCIVALILYALRLFGII